MSPLLPGINTAAFLAVLIVVSIRFGVLARTQRGFLTPVKFMLLAGVSLAGTAGFSLAWGMSQSGFAFAFSTGLALGLLDPVIAVCVLISGTLLRPWELVDAPSMSVIPKVAGAACLFSWIMNGLRDRRLTLVWNWPVRLFLCFAIWVLLSALLTGGFEAGLTDYGNTLLIAGILFIFVINIINTPEALRTAERCIVASVAGVIGVALVSTSLHNETGEVKERLEGFGLLGNANDLAALITLAVPLLLVPLLTARRSERSLARTAISAAVLGVMLTGLWSSQSRGAFIGLFGSAAAYLIARSRRPARGFFYAVLLSPAVVGAFRVLGTVRQSDDMSASSESRLNYVLAGLNMALHNPIMGVGFGNYPNLYEAYAPTIEYEWGQRTAHSTWILALAETGFPGFFLLVALFALTLRAAWRARATHPELLSALVGYSVAMSFLSHTYTLFPYLIFALVLAAARMRPRAGRPDRDPGMDPELQAVAAMRKLAAGG